MERVNGNGQTKSGSWENKMPSDTFQGEYDRVSDPRMTAAKNSHDPKEGYIEDLETRETD